MVSLESFRCFCAVYRGGSVTAAAQMRGVSQPAISQQLAALESSLGVALFERTSRGMSPTPRAKALYAELFEPLDRLESVIRGLARETETMSLIRLGTSPEFFEGFALRRLQPLCLPLVVTFGNEAELLSQLVSGALDVAILSQRPTVRSIQYHALGEQRFALIGPVNGSRPPRDCDFAQLGAWLNAQPWVSYSEERPVTRRFWQHTLGMRFAATPALVVADMRTVVSAVAMGIGISIVPEFICRDALADDRVRQIWPIGDLIPAERKYVLYRDVDSDRAEIRQMCNALAAI